MNENIGKIIKRIRTEKKMSQRYLAKRAGITHPYLCNVENGKNQPSYDVVMKLAIAMDVDFRTFRDDSDSGCLVKEIINMNAKEIADITFDVIEHVNAHSMDEFDLSSLDSERIRDIHGLIVDVVKNRLNEYCNRVKK